MWQRNLKTFLSRPLSFPIEKIALAAVITSFCAPLFSAADPCLLCKIQRFSWLLALGFGLFGWREPKVGGACVWLMRTSLALVFGAAALQMLVHLGAIPDLCHSPKTAFASPEEYLAYLTSHPPCDEAILKVMGVPAYILSLLGAASAFFLSFFNNHIQKTPKVSP